MEKFVEAAKKARIKYYKNKSIRIKFIKICLTT